MTGRATAPAVILGGRGTAVPVARSLGAAGVPVAALGADPWEPVRFSRFCSHYFWPSAADGDVQAAWLAWLEREARAGGVLIPCSDDGLELVARHDLRLRELGYVTSHDPAVVPATLDKAETYRLAREAGLPTPRTLVVEWSQEPDPERAGIGFPCALKPLASHRFARHFDGKAFIVRDAEELRAVHRLTAERGVRMMLTEIVPGDDDQLVAYVSYLDDAGQPLIEFTHRKLRQWPTGFGLSCYAVNHLEPEVARLGLTFLRHLGLHGVSEVEFKRDARDGVWKLIECNARFTIQIVGAADELPLLAYRRAAGLDETAMPSVRLGTHLWNPIQDLRALRSLHGRSSTAAAGWLRALRPPVRTHVFRPDDPLPTLGHHVGVALYRARARLARTSGRGAAPPGPPSSEKPAASRSSAEVATA